MLLRDGKSWCYYWSIIINTINVWNYKQMNHWLENRRCHSWWTMILKEPLMGDAYQETTTDFTINSWYGSLSIPWWWVPLYIGGPPQCQGGNSSTTMNEHLLSKHCSGFISWFWMSGETPTKILQIGFAFQVLVIPVTASPQLHIQAPWRVNHRSSPVNYIKFNKPFETIYLPHIHHTSTTIYHANAPPPGAATARSSGSLSSRQKDPLRWANAWSPKCEDIPPTGNAKGQFHGCILVHSLVAGWLPRPKNMLVNSIIIHKYGWKHNVFEICQANGRTGWFVAGPTTREEPNDRYMWRMAPWNGPATKLSQLWMRLMYPDPFVHGQCPRKWAQLISGTTQGAGGNFQNSETDRKRRQSAMHGL